MLFLLLLQFSLTSANWWLLAMPSANQIISQISPRNYKEQCWRMPRTLLPEPRQRELCTLSENMLLVVSMGAKMALFECQNQFSTRRWNCSTSLSAMYRQVLDETSRPHRLTSPMIAKSALKPQATGRMLADVPLEEIGKKEKNAKIDPPKQLDDLFGGVLNFDSREKAYVYSISAAGVAYSITRACRDGRLPACKCDPRKRKQKAGKTYDWTWGGCSDHVRYGERISKDFVDSTETSTFQDPARRLMNLHNNEAGRRALRKTQERTCKCHGISGSCTLKVCWRQLRSFEEIGDYLRRKFDGATRVLYRKKRHRLATVQKDIKRPTKKDLVYLQESPDYCAENDKLGIVGTTGRKCQRDSYGMDGCLLMCCGRGYTTKIVKETRECNCKFQWCCKVVCERCKVTVVQHRCK